MKVNKKTIIIIVIGIVILLIVLYLLGVLHLSKTPEEQIGDKVLKNDDFQYELKQKEIELKEEVTVSDFSVRYYAKERKWFIEMVFENNLDKEVNLNNYNVNAYDKDNNIVKSIETKVLGELLPKERRGLTIESKEDISSITKILIEKK